MGGPNVSHGGALIGRCTSPDRAFVYTEAAGFVDLGTLVGFSRYDPWSVSLAGDVVFGDAGNEPGEPTTVFRYAAKTGIEALGTFEGQTSSTHRPGVRGIARDGSVAIGDWYDATGNYPYIWDATGIRTLPAPAGFPFASVHAVHPDGVFVAGATQVHAEPFVSEAVLWNLDATPRLLAQELESAGIDLGETNLQAVDAFAPSGTIVGGAQRGEGYYLRFLARVP